jgi:hypothetical protein
LVLAQSTRTVSQLVLKARRLAALTHSTVPPTAAASTAIRSVSRRPIDPETLRNDASRLPKWPRMTGRVRLTCISTYSVRLRMGQGSATGPWKLGGEAADELVDPEREQLALTPQFAFSSSRAEQKYCNNRAART